jgi:hypothetical protein
MWQTRTIKLILSKRKSELIEPQKNLFKEKMIVGMFAVCFEFKLRIRSTGV